MSVKEVNPSHILTAHCQNTRHVTALAKMGSAFTSKERVRGMTLHLRISDGHRRNRVGCVQKTDSTLQERHAEI